jgi:hypothetical protein
MTALRHDSHQSGPDSTQVPLNTNLRTYGEWRRSSTHFYPLHWVKKNGSLHAWTLYPPPPRERAPGTHWIGGWVGPIAGLDAGEKRKIPAIDGN